MTTGTWLAQGPGPSRYGQTENVAPDNEVVGAIHVVAAHPSDADVLYAGGVNGGIWKTTNGSAASPTWTPLTDDLASLSIGALELDPTDATNKTLIAGIGRFSSFSSQGGPRSGLLYTTDGGSNWTEIDGGGSMQGKNIVGVSARGSTILAAVNYADSYTFGNIGIFRSTDTGNTFSQISNGNGTATGLPGGVTHDLGSNPNFSTSTYYTSVIYANIVGGTNGVYKSTDTGATWIKVSDAAIEALLADNAVSNVEITVGNGGTVYVSILKSGQLRNGGVFVSTNGGTTWTQMDTPLVNETGGTVGTNPTYKPEANAPGSQGAIHFSISVDPADDDIVYVGGDRQPAGYHDLYGFPNALGANNYTGRLFRGNSSVTATGGVPSPQWKHLTHTQDAAGMIGGGTLSNSAPHADSREIMFDAAGNLIEVDDGGIYVRTNPQSNTGDWFSINGNIQVTEQHDVAYDSISNIIISGNQDTGSTQQTSPGSSTWDSVSTADGGDVAVSVDPTNPSQSIRYSSYQYLGGLVRNTYDASGNLVTTVYPPLTVTSGSALTTHFTTPLEINTVDSTRLLIGGGNGLYESLDQGTTIQQKTSLAINSGGGNTMVYGGTAGGIDNPDLIYAAQGSDIVKRTTTGGAIVSVGGYAGGTVRGVFADRDDWASVFAIDGDKRVFHSTNAGATWTNITGDLPTTDFGFDLRSIDIIQKHSVKALVVGTTEGVFASIDPNYDTWSRVGLGLPNAPVWDLDYDPNDDVLVAGTLGRGSWLLANASGNVSNSSGDELAADFGTNGLWHYDGAWSRLSSWDPGTAGLAGWSQGLAVDFDANGLWSHDGSSWHKLTGWNAGEAIAGWSGGLAVDFDANGLWSHDGTSWHKLASWNAEALASWFNGLAADFGTNGLWTYDGSSWRRLTRWNPGDGGLAGWSEGLAVDFDANGTWSYDGSNWHKMTSWNPGTGGLSGWSEGLAVDFDANGTWGYDGTSWRRLSTWNPGDALAGWGGDLAVDFDANGLWNNDGTSWSKLTGWNAQALEAVDLNP